MQCPQGLTSTSQDSYSTHIVPSDQISEMFRVPAEQREKVLKGEMDYKEEKKEQGENSSSTALSHFLDMLLIIDKIYSLRASLWCFKREEEVP